MARELQLHASVVLSAAPLIKVSVSASGMTNVGQRGGNCNCNCQTVVTAAPAMTFLQMSAKPPRRAAARSIQHHAGTESLLSKRNKQTKKKEQKKKSKRLSVRWSGTCLLPVGRVSGGWGGPLLHQKGSRRESQEPPLRSDC